MTVVDQVGMMKWLIHEPTVLAQVLEMPSHIEVMEHQLTNRSKELTIHFVLSSASALSLMNERH